MKRFRCNLSEYQEWIWHFNGIAVALVLSPQLWWDNNNFRTGRAQIRPQHCLQPHLVSKNWKSGPMSMAHMTADPRVISSLHHFRCFTYSARMELFALRGKGSLSTDYSARLSKAIPVQIKNTLNPEHGRNPWFVSRRWMVKIIPLKGYPPSLHPNL